MTVQHERDKQSPWRVRGIPVGGGAGPSQAPDSEDVNAAMAGAGDLAAFFPSTQADADTTAHSPVDLPSTAADADAAGKTDQDSKAGTDVPAAVHGAGAKREPACAAQAHQAGRTPAKTHSQAKSKSRGPSPAAAPAAAGQQPTGASIVRDSDDEGQQPAGSGVELQEEEAKTSWASGRDKGLGKTSNGTDAGDGEEGAKGKGKAGRGRGGRGSQAPMGRGSSRGRKGGSQGTAAKRPKAAIDDDVTAMDVDAEQPKVLAS